MLHQVITTEKVPVTYRVAGMGSRFLAWLTDCGVIIVLALMGIAASIVLDTRRQGIGSAAASVWIFVLQWGYFLFFEWLWAGQTPGKRVLGIRVIQDQGAGVSFYQAAVRNVLRVVDSLPAMYALGFVVAACDSRHRRLGDLAARTLVVHMEHKARAVQALPDVPRTGERAREAVLRQRLNQLDREQKQAVLDLCLRREQLPARDRAQMFRAAALVFESRLGLTRGDYQSDERFVLEIASVLGGRPEAARTT